MQIDISEEIKRYLEQHLKVDVTLEQDNDGDFCVTSEVFLGDVKISTSEDYCIVSKD